MTPKRTIVVGVAVGVGLLAAVLSYVFLNGAQQRAYHGAKLVPAYVVDKAVPRAMTGSEAVSGGYFTQESVPSKFRPSTAITSLADLNGKEAVAPYAVGQVLVTSMFVSPTAATSSFSQLIPAGDVAVSISVDQVHSVSGLAVAGDKVDLFVTVNNQENSLLQNVPIIAVGQSTSNLGTAAQNTSVQTDSVTPTTQANSNGLYTFDVTPAQAASIAYAQQESLGLYMVLVPAGNPVVSIPSVTPGNLTSGSQAAG
jgi:pilus assembly protein CpaB